MAPLRQFALVLGAVLLIIGILGFFEPLMTVESPIGDGSTVSLLFGLFAVNTVHNLVHIASGILGIAAGLISWPASRLYAQAFGVVYGLVTVAGMLSPEGTMFLGILPLNLADTVLHLIITVAALYFGFSRRFVPRTI